MDTGEDLLTKILQLEAKVPQQETLMIALNHILKLKEVVGEKMTQLGQKDTQLETKMNKLEQKDSQLEAKLNELESRELGLKRILELETVTEKEESPHQTDHPTSFIQISPDNVEILSRSSGKSGNPRTCREIHSSDPSLPSGMFWIDPDGQGVGDDAIYVHCDMTTGT
jgi:predicted nuclease with TOPRIM domain